MSHARINPSFPKKYGFSELRPSRGGTLYEKGNVRFHTCQISRDPPRWQCQTIFPEVSIVIQMLLPTNPEGEAVRLARAGNRYVITEFASSGEELDGFAARAGQMAVLCMDQGADQPAGLSNEWMRLPQPEYEKGMVLQEIVVILKTYLGQVRAMQVQADLPSLAACLAILEPLTALEINPFILSRDKGKILDLLEKARDLLGCVILINMDVLRGDEQTHAALISFCTSLNMEPEYVGGRILLYQEGDGRQANRALPFLALPDIYGMAFRPLLEDAQIAVTRSAISYLACAANNRMDADQAMNVLKTQARLARDNADPDQDLALGRRLKPCTPSGPERAQELQAMGMSLLDAHVVGHENIRSPLLQTLLMYFLTGMNRPLVLLFAGASGVGKNYMAKVVSHILQRFFESEVPRYSSFSASSLVSRWGLSQLTGVQAGLKGMEREGLLERWASAAGGVLTVDEIDKSTNELQDFLLEMFDNGHFRNGYGQLVRLPRGAIILTMNAGREELYDKVGESLGFVAPAGPAAETTSYYRRSVEKTLLPALRGRIDRIFYFGHLSKKELLEVGIRELSDFRDRLSGSGIPWPFSDPEAAVGELLDHLDIRLGARGMVKAVERMVARLTLSSAGEEVRQKGTECPSPKRKTTRKSF